MSQAQREYERKQAFHKEVSGDNENTFEQVKVKVPRKPYEPTKEERQSHEATHCPFRAWCEICVKAKSPDGKHTKQLVDMEHILVIEFDYAFATDTPGDPNRKISMMVATDSIHESIFAVVARRKGGQDDYVMQNIQNYIDRLGLVKAELKCAEEPSTLDVAKRFDQKVFLHSSDCDCNAKRLERELGMWRKRKLDDSGTASSIS